MAEIRYSTEFSTFSTALTAEIMFKHKIQQSVDYLSCLIFLIKHLAKSLICGIIIDRDLFKADSVMLLLKLYCPR